MSKNIPRAIVAVTLALVMAGGTALAQRGDRGSGRGDGGRGSSGVRSSGGGQSSARSSGSSQSSSRGQSAARSSGPSQSFSRGQSSARSSSPSRSSGSSRAFSGTPSRSVQPRSSGQPSRGTVSRPSDSGRSFSGPSRSPGFQGSPGRSGDRPTFSRGSDAVPRGTDAIRGRQPSDRAGQTETRDRPSFGEPRVSDRGRQTYEARRPTEDQLRGFLGRGDDRSRQRDGQFTRTPGDRGDFRGRISDRDTERTRSEIRERLGIDRDRDRGDIADRIRDRDRDRDFRDRDRDFSGRDRGRDFVSRDRDGRGERDYDSWRRGTWLGERGEGRDQRDWSGRWRDGDRFDRARHVRDRWRDRDDYPFRYGWWGGRGGWNFWDRHANRFGRPFYWWSWVAAPRLATWVTFGWPNYYYWDYGPGEYIYYQDGVIFVNGRWYQPAPVFYERTVQLVEQAPELTPEEAAQMEWLPLGVFAVTRDGVAEPDILVQLAVTQDGVLGGTAFLPGSDQAYPIEGIVEKETQRAVWSYTDDSGRRVLQETSIFNLTQPEATGLVHYGPDQIEVIQLVRLEAPEGEAVTTAAGGELPAPTPR